MRPLTLLGSFVGCALVCATVSCGGLAEGGGGATGDGGLDMGAPDHSLAHGESGGGEPVAGDAPPGGPDGAANDAASCGLGLTQFALTTGIEDAIAVGPTGVYWSEWAVAPHNRIRGTLLKLPLCGGTPVTLRTELEERYDGIALDSTSVYLAEGLTGAILKLPLGGGAASTLARKVLPKAIAIDETSVYWTNGGLAHSVLKVPVNGGAAVTLGSQGSGGAPPAQWGAIAVESATVYWLGLGTYTELLTVPIGGGAVTTLHAAKGGRGVAVDATDVFWTDHTHGEILRMPLGAGAVTTLASNLETPFAIAVDASNVYWTDHENGGHGRVTKVPRSGGPPTVIASEQSLSDNSLQQLAVYDASVYWLTVTDVMIAPK